MDEITYNFHFAPSVECNDSLCPDFTFVELIISQTSIKLNLASGRSFGVPVS